MLKVDYLLVSHEKAFDPKLMSHSKSSWTGVTRLVGLNEPPHDKSNKLICAPSEDFDQPGHPPSLISLRGELSG